MKFFDRAPKSPNECFSPEDVARLARLMYDGINDVEIRVRNRRGTALGAEDLLLVCRADPQDFHRARIFLDARAQWMKELAWRFDHQGAYHPPSDTRTANEIADEYGLEAVLKFMERSKAGRP